MSEEHSRKGPSNHRLKKVALNLEPSDWHNHAMETVWAEQVGGDKYRLQNVPFYAYGVSFGDVVRAREIGGQLIVQDVLGRDGHSTCRVFLSEGVTSDDDRFKRVWQPLEAIGASYERANNRLFAVDIPAATDIYSAYELLKAGEEAGVWDFEEAYCGHALTR